MFHSPAYLISTVLTYLKVNTLHWPLGGTRPIDRFCCKTTPDLADKAGQKDGGWSSSRHRGQASGQPKLLVAQQLYTQCCQMLVS